MATKKRQIAFYADDVVSEWYEALAPGEGTRRINEYLHQAIEREKSLEDRVKTLEMLSKAADNQIVALNKTIDDQSRAIVENAAINFNLVQLLHARFKSAGGSSKDLEVLVDLGRRADKLLTFDM